MEAPQKLKELALAGVTQWTECWPMSQKVAGSIPSQDTCLGCGPGPWLGTSEGQPHIDVSLPCKCFSPSLSLPLLLSLKIKKKKERVTIRPSNPSSGYLPEKFENIYSQRSKHPHVHWSIIHNGQDMEATKLTFNRCLDKEDVVHIHNEIPLSYKKR